MGVIVEVIADLMAFLGIIFFAVASITLVAFVVATWRSR